MSLKDETLILESVDLNSISVPPLKSIPKFKPLNVSKINESINNLGEYNNIEYNLNELTKILIKENYNQSNIDKIKNNFKEIEIIKMNINNNILLIKYIKLLNNNILQLQNNNLEQIKNKIIKDKKKTIYKKYLKKGSKYLLNKLSYHYPLIINKPEQIVYNLNLNINNLDKLYFINNRIFNKDIKLYKITNSYRISLILKYIPFLSLKKILLFFLPDPPRM